MLRAPARCNLCARGRNRPLFTVKRNPKERARLPDIARNPPESHAKRRGGGRAFLCCLNSHARFVVEFWPESGAIRKAALQFSAGILLTLETQQEFNLQLK